MLSVGLATCREFPLLDDEDRLLLPAMAALGIEGVPAVWTDETIDWSAFDAVVIRATWDYSEVRPAFLDWTRGVAAVTRLLNPAPVVEWNTDKRYLRDIAAAGLPVVQTVFLEPGDATDGWRPEGDVADVVVKPAVSCGSRDTMRYDLRGDHGPLQAHLSRLLDDGRVVMVQPYLEAVDTIGETALVFLGGEYSHAIRKGPLLSRGVKGEMVGGLFAPENIAPRVATADERSAAEAIVRCIPGGPDEVLYARVDLIPGPDGRPRLLELELTEPSLFLSHAQGAPERMAAAVAARLARRPDSSRG